MGGRLSGWLPVGLRLACAADVTMRSSMAAAATVTAVRTVTFLCFWLSEYHQFWRASHEIRRAAVAALWWAPPESSALAHSLLLKAVYPTLPRTSKGCIGI